MSYSQKDFSRRAAHGSLWTSTDWSLGHLRVPSVHCLLIDICKWHLWSHSFQQVIMSHRPPLNCLREAQFGRKCVEKTLIKPITLLLSYLSIYSCFSCQVRVKGIAGITQPSKYLKSVLNFSNTPYPRHFAKSYVQNQRKLDLSPSSSASQKTNIFYMQCQVYQDEACPRAKQWMKLLCWETLVRLIG